MGRCPTEFCLCLPSNQVIFSVSRLHQPDWIKPELSAYWTLDKSSPLFPCGAVRSLSQLWASCEQRKGQVTMLVRCSHQAAQPTQQPRSWPFLWCNFLMWKLAMSSGPRRRACIALITSPCADYAASQTCVVPMLMTVKDCPQHPNRSNLLKNHSFS